MVFMDLPLTQEFKTLGMDNYLWVQALFNHEELERLRGQELTNPHQRFLWRIIRVVWGFIPDILDYTLFFAFKRSVPPPPDLNTLLNCSLCNSSPHAYLYHEGYVVLAYRKNTPKGLWTTNCNSWTWIKSHNGDKDLPKALCCCRMMIEDWDYRQQGKISF